MRSIPRILALSIVLLGPSVAVAQPNVRRAEQLAAEGLTLYRQAAYEQAIAKFEESYRLVPDANNLFNIGKCYERINKFEEAIRAYRRYIVEAENSTDRAEVENRIANIENRPARVHISSNPSKATVWVDDTSGAPAGQTPVTLELGPGAHVITLRLQGYEQSTRPVSGGLGREIALDIAMAPVSQGSGDGGGTQTVYIERDGRTVAVPAEEEKRLHLGATLGVSAGSVGTQVTLNATPVFGVRLGYGLPLASKIVLDIAASGSFEPREAGDPAHAVNGITALLEPSIRLILSEMVHLSVGGGIGFMVLLGLEKGDEYFEDPESELSGSLLGFLDIHGGARVWIHFMEDLAAVATLGLDYAPKKPGIAGDFVRFGGGVGAVYRF